MQYGYDAGSNVTSARLRDGAVVSMGYDALNRLNARSGATVAAQGFGYDNLGALTSATRAGSPDAAFGYDALGRLVSESAGLGAFVQGYDLAGRRTSLTWPDGFGVVYGRLVTGEIASVGEAGTTAVPLLMGYDDLGRRTSLSRGSGHGQSYAWDAADRLTAWSLAGLAGGTTTAWLSYNPASQVKLRQTSDEQLSANVAYNVDRAYAANGLNTSIPRPARRGWTTTPGGT